MRSNILEMTVYALNSLQLFLDVRAFFFKSRVIEINRCQLQAIRKLFSFQRIVKISSYI